MSALPIFRAEPGRSLGDHRIDEVNAAAPSFTLVRATRGEQRVLLFVLPRGLAADVSDGTLERERSRTGDALQFGVDEGTPWLAVPHAAGRPFREAKQPLPHEPPALLAALGPLFDQLVDAHAAGRVHGAITPHHVLFDGRRFVLVGIEVAGWIAQRSARSSAAAGDAAPEAWTLPELRDGRAAGPSSDVWALAMLVRELLSRHPLAHLAPSPQSASAPIDPRIAAEFERWFQRATHPDPSARYRDAAEATAALRPILGGVDLAPLRPAPILANPKGSFYDAALSRQGRGPVPPPRQTGPRPSGRHPGAVLLGLALGLALGLVAGGLVAYFVLGLRPIP